MSTYGDMLPRLGPALAAVALACPGAHAAGANVVKNASMSEGGATPTHWDKTENVELVRDTEVFFKGPASLCVVSEGKGGNANQKVTVLAGKTVAIGGHVKREPGLDSVQVFTLAFDRNWKSLGWDMIMNVLPRGGWQRFEKIHTFPPDTATVLFGVLAKGTGKAWLDEVEMRPVEARSAVEGRSSKVYDLSGYRGPQPKLYHVGMAGPDVLFYHLREYFNEYGSFGRYEPKSGDEIVKKGRNRFLKRNGAVGSTALSPPRGKEVGTIGGPEGNLHLKTHDRRVGKPFQLRYALDPASYTLSGPDGGIEVSAVYRKSKPVDNTKDGYCREHMIFLRLAKPLEVGARYALDFGRVDLDTPRAEFTFDPRRLRSEAVHVSQVGYRPDDPVKIGFLSMWMGTGGAYDGYRDGTKFEIVEARTGKAVYSGRTEVRAARTKAAHGLHAKGRNFELADTYVCDFSGLSKPGEYVLSVEGVGTSFPFAIGDGTWQLAFATSMRGFYHQRSGQAWEKPYAAWDRPRDLHPADGPHNTVYELTISELDFSSGLGDGKLHKLLEYRTEKTLPEAWGGYHDAGDYDRRQSHMVCSRRMMELLELFPEYFRRLRLPIPENGNRIPDLLDEALWCPSLYRRMQREDGAVRGGIETNGHPSKGEPSHLDTLTKMAFAPDVRASWTYAATAAQAAYLLERERQHESAGAVGSTRRGPQGRSARRTTTLSPPRGEWRASALRAMEWAEAEYSANRARYEEMKAHWRTKDVRNLAAAYLFRLTGNDRWHRVFLETCGYRGQEKPRVFAWGRHVQSEAAMVYARLADDLGDAVVKAEARRALLDHAEFQIDYASKQAYMFTADDIGAPLIISSHAAPRGLDICRAHYLSGERRYLEWAIKTSQFSVGANPMNLVMTTGLGRRPAMYPLYLDMKYMGERAPPPGITLYGIRDPKFGGHSWAYKWILDWQENCVPGYREWPLSEFFFDTYAWPMVNEFTVQQSMAPAVYVYGYLAARGG